MGDGEAPQQQTLGNETRRVSIDYLYADEEDEDAFDIEPTEQERMLSQARLNCSFQIAASNYSRIHFSIFDIMKIQRSTYHNFEFQFVSSQRIMSNDLGRDTMLADACKPKLFAAMSWLCK